MEPQRTVHPDNHEHVVVTPLTPPCLLGTLGPNSRPRGMSSIPTTTGTRTDDWATSRLASTQRTSGSAILMGAAAKCFHAETAGCIELDSGHPSRNYFLEAFRSGTCKVYASSSIAWPTCGLPAPSSSWRTRRTPTAWPAWTSVSQPTQWAPRSGARADTLVQIDHVRTRAARKAGVQ